MNELEIFKQSLETYKAIKEDYKKIFYRKSKGEQVSELELGDFIERIKRVQPLMYAGEQRKDLKEITIVINNLIDYMQIKRGKRPFQGVDFSLWDVLNPRGSIVTVEMLEQVI